MYGACNQLFACSCFTRNEDRRIAWRDFGDARENTFQSGRCSNNLFKHRGFVDFFTQSDVFAPKPVFSLLAIFDVRPRNIPTCNLSLFVPQWVKTCQEPAITSITPSQPQLQLVSRGTSDSTIKKNVAPLFVIRINVVAGTRRLTPLFETKAEVIEQDVVGVKAFTVRAVHRNKLRREVQDLAKFLLALAQGFR